MASRRTKIRIPNRLGLFEENTETLLDSFGQAIDQICSKSSISLSFEYIYRLVYTLTLRKKGPETYKKLQLHLIKALLNEREKIETYEGITLLDHLLIVWQDQCLQYKLLSEVMIYMEKVYCKQEMKPETYNFAVDLFKQEIVIPLAKQIDEAMIQQINNIRRKRSTEESCTELCRKVVSLMESLDDQKDNYFISHFEPILMVETEGYYQWEMKDQDLDSVGRLDFMKGLKLFENDLDSKILNTDSAVKINGILEKVLLWNQDFLNDVPTVVRLSVDTNRIELMKELCQLSEDTNYCNTIQDSIKKCILDDANALDFDAVSKKRTQAATKWTTGLIELYGKYIKFLEDADFSPESSDSETAEDIHHSVRLLNNTFSEFLNEQGKQAIDALALYLDAFLKMTQPRREVERIKRDLDACVKLLRLLSEKDLFVSAYKQQMSRRLLQHRSMIEVERWMVKRIKDELGVFFTTKLDGMLRDMNTSSEISRSFKNSMAEERWPEALEFTPQILTMTSWPFQAPTASEDDIILPTNLEQVKLDFESFYIKKYSERTLQWAHNLGYIELGFQFNESYHEISMPIPAAIICLLFERYDQLTIEMIEEHTRIPEQELQKHLTSLTIVPKSRILRKKPMSRSISPNDIFTINYQFTAPTRKVKVQPVSTIIPAQKSDSSLDLIQESMKRERLSETNAAIVRIMKSHRRLSHSELTDLVTEEVKKRFPMNGPLLKKSINYLLEKEYVQRDPEDLSIYHYIT